MQRSITIKGQSILYELRKTSKARSIRLRIQGAGELVVSAPTLVPSILVDQFVKQKGEWILNKIVLMKEKNKDKIHITDPKEKRAIRQKAIVSVLEKVKKWNAGLGYEISKITVKEQKTCWGTCNRDKQLNFNWKLGLLPDHLVDYVVVHELCHLKELNHSPRFWKLVENLMPDYKRRKKELAEKGMNIS